MDTLSEHLMLSQGSMASSSTALDTDCIEEDDGTSEPVLTEAHVRDVFSHWEAGTAALAGGFLLSPRCSQAVQSSVCTA